jgi:hypothetical protein
MQSIAKEAQRISLLFDYGVLTGNEVIAWADSVIVELDSPPDSLIELSTVAPERTGDIISHLHRLSTGSDFWVAVKSAIPQIRDFIAAHPNRAEDIANHFYRTACSRMADIPKELNFFFRFDDAFSLANQGILGERRDIYRDFINELTEFASTT